MTEASEFLLEHPIAQRLADLAGVQHDLLLVIRACDRFLSHPTVGSEEAIFLSRSVATFAIISYCRTITSGVRSGISEANLATLSMRLKDSHDKFKNIRDKFVAHSVNYSEDNSVQIGLVPVDGGTLKLDTIGTTHSRTATFSNEDMLELKELATALNLAVDAEYDAQSDLVWDFLEALTPADLQRTLSLPSRPTYRPPQKARKQFR